MENINQKKTNIICIAVIYPLLLLVMFILPFYSAEGYSMIKNTTSQLGAQHTPNARVMNSTFVLLGLATIIDGWRFLGNFWLHKIVITVFGSALILVAFYRHAPITENVSYDISADKLHSVFATITGFSFTLFSVAAAFIEKTLQRKMLALLVAVFATAMSIMMFTLTDYTGVWQRLNLIISFAWLIFFYKKKNEMKRHKLGKYLFNCFWLIIPPLLISFLLVKYLPEAFQANIFWSNIPFPVKNLENIFRIIVMALPVFFPFIIKREIQRTGLAVYFIGVTLYLFSYLALIYFPESSWSNSLIGFTAPATTPVIWLTGIGLIMEKPFFNIGYKKWIYLILVIAFCVFHFIHTSIIYHRYY